MQSPEELAREKIDALLQQCGWILQNRSTINLSAGRGIAIRDISSIQRLYSVLRGEEIFF
jgi:type I restriction enzyme R subunit